MNTIFVRRANIGSDALVKEVEGQKVVEFSIAENKKFKDQQGNDKESTNWYKCSMWTSHTAIAEFLKKGACVNVIGKLSFGAYMNKSNSPAVDARISVSEVDLLDKKEKEDTTVQPTDQELASEAHEDSENNPPV